ELAERFATSPDVKDCMSANWFRYATSRADGSGDACGLRSLQDQFIESQGNVRDLMVAIANAPEFRSRAVSSQQMERE
ncbi:MAG: DUF1585 domain-containing protein, partial [Myxococcota bacterium]